MTRRGSPCPSMSARSRRIAGAVIAVALVAGACTRQEARIEATPAPNDGSTTTTGVPATSTLSSPTGPTITAPPAPPASSPLLDTLAPLKLPPTLNNPVQRKIFEDYLRAEQAAIRASMEPVNPAGPDLSARIGEPNLATTRQYLRGLQDSGHALAAPDVFEVRPAKFRVASEKGVVFYSCFTIHEVRYAVRSREVVSDEMLSSMNEVVMELIEGEWRMTVRSERDEWKGRSCDDVASSL